MIELKSLASLGVLPLGKVERVRLEAALRSPSPVCSLFFLTSDI